MSYNKWEKKDVDYLLNNYRLKSVINIAKDLNRHYGLVRNKLISLKLSGISSVSKPTIKEIDFIKQNYLELTNISIAKILEINPRRVSWIMNKYKLKRIKLNPNIEKQLNITCIVCKTVYPKTTEFFYFGKKIITSCKKCTLQKVRNCTNKDIKSYLKLLLRGIISDSKRNNKCGDFVNIDLDYLLAIYEKQDNKCIITGLKLNFGNLGGRDLLNVSIDRIDSFKGYIEGNIQLLCHWANIAKSTLTMDEFNYYIKTSFSNLNKN